MLTLIKLVAPRIRPSLAMVLRETSMGQRR